MTRAMIRSSGIPTTNNRASQGENAWAQDTKDRRLVETPVFCISSRNPAMALHDSDYSMAAIIETTKGEPGRKIYAS